MNRLVLRFWWHDVKRVAGNLFNRIVIQHLPNWFVYSVANHAAARYSTEGAHPKKHVPNMTMMEMLGWWSCK